MYIMITDRCNMSCEHCCYNCTSSGKDMTLKTWGAALKLCLDMGEEYLTIGGGEPTLHSRFWQFLGEAMGNVDGVWLGTNGSNTKIALALARLAKRGVVGVALSLDSYHDKIDPVVEEAFGAREPPHQIRYGTDRTGEDLREIRNVDGKELNAGRCDFGKSGCPCPDIVITPSGVIKGCGCEDAKEFGTVFKPNLPSDREDCCFGRA